MGRSWFKEYLENHDINKDDLKSEKCHQEFCFGPS
jgi:hypothetical protein